MVIKLPSFIWNAKISDTITVVTLILVLQLLGPTQVNCQLLMSSIYYAMNFRHFLEMLKLDLWHF